MTDIPKHVREDKCEHLDLTTCHGQTYCPDCDEKFVSASDLGFFDPKAAEKDATVLIKASALSALRSKLQSRDKEVEELVEALEMFNNRRKLAHSLRGESPHIAAFVEAIGVEIDKILEKFRGGE